MAASQSLLDPRALRRITHLEFVARLVVEGTFSGFHRSPFHGFSPDFLQHRPYVAGDDIRYLDWKVFGKTDRHFVREYHDETNLRATLLLDASGSMDFASAGISKLHYAVRLAASLAYLFVAQHDAVGLLVFDRVARKLLPPKTGRRQLKHVLDELAAVRAGGETSLATVLHDLAPRLPKRGVVFLLTDAFDAVPSLINALASFRYARHETVLFQILDRQEVEFRFNQWTRFDCLEQADQKTLVDPAQIRQAYLDRFRSFQDELRQGCHDNRSDFVPVITDTAYDETLASYLFSRGKRT